MKRKNIISILVPSLLLLASNAFAWGEYNGSWKSYQNGGWNYAGLDVRTSELYWETIQMWPFLNFSGYVDNAQAAQDYAVFSNWEPN